MSELDLLVGRKDHQPSESVNPAETNLVGANNSGDQTQGDQ